jgi:hypothetical protein
MIIALSPPGTLPAGRQTEHGQQLFRRGKNMFHRTKKSKEAL